MESKDFCIVVRNIYGYESRYCGKDPADLIRNFVLLVESLKVQVAALEDELKMMQEAS